MTKKEDVVGFVGRLLWVPFQFGLFLVLLQLTACSSNDQEVAGVQYTPQIQQTSNLVVIKSATNGLTVLNSQQQVIFQSQNEVIRDVQVAERAFAYRQGLNDLVVRDANGQVTLAELGVTDFQLSDQLIAYRIHQQLTVKNISTRQVIATDCKVSDYRISNGAVAYLKEIEDCDKSKATVTSEDETEFDVLHVVGLSGNRILRRTNVVDFQLSDRHVGFRDEDDKLTVRHLSGYPVSLGSTTSFVSGAGVSVVGELPPIHGFSIEAVEFKMSNNLLAVVRDYINGYAHVNLYDLERSVFIKDFYVFNYTVSNEFFAYETDFMLGGRVDLYHAVVNRNKKLVFMDSNVDSIAISDRFVVFRTPDGMNHAFVADLLAGPTGTPPGPVVQYPQYPNNQYPNNQYPNNQYPNNQYPNNQYSNNQYPNNNQNPNLNPQVQPQNGSSTDLFANRYIQNYSMGSQSIVYTQINPQTNLEEIHVVNASGQDVVIQPPQQSGNNNQLNSGPVHVTTSGGKLD